MKEIESLSEFQALIKKQKCIKNVAIQGVDLTSLEGLILRVKISDCLFLGCKLTNETYYHLIELDNLVFPKFNVDFKVFRNKLYSKEELYDKFIRKNPETYFQTLDYRINKYYNKTGRNEPINIYESLLRRLHDHSITNALYDIISLWDKLKIVAIMGGHKLPRNSKEYLKVALIGKGLAERGYLLLTGGGPGGMEATHLGTWFANRNKDELRQAIKILSIAPNYKDKLWLATSFEVIEKYPPISKVESIGIPTWFYGHEPPTPFAIHIAKYFANSVREEGLLTIAKGGVIFAPGSIGTVQEVFQETAQNHYTAKKNISPMVFLDKNYWSNIKPVYPLLKSLAKEEHYYNALSIHNTPQEVIEAIQSFTQNH